MVFWSLFLRSPEAFRAYLGRNNSFISSQRRGSKPSNSQSSWCFLHWKHVKDQLLQNKWIAVWQPAFRARKVLGTFKKQAPVVFSRYRQQLKLECSLWLACWVRHARCTFRMPKIILHIQPIKINDFKQRRRQRQGRHKTLMERLSTGRFCDTDGNQK